jgi:hypothetical protein
MGILSNILDISGFFLIVVINLSLIALLCYYAKKKFESIEEIQKEQSKILFNLVHSASNTTVNGPERTNQIDPMFLSPTMVIPQVNEISEENKIINMSSTGPQVINLESDSESDSDDESDEDEKESAEEDETESAEEDDSESAEEENDSDGIEDLTINEENTLILE